MHSFYQSWLRFPHNDIIKSISKPGGDPWIPGNLSPVNAKLEEYLQGNYHWPKNKCHEFCKVIQIVDVLTGYYSCLF